MLNQEKLLAALNALNSPPEPFTLDNVTLSSPAPYIGPAPWNTKISIAAIPAQGYSGRLDFYYHRIDLVELKDLILTSAQPFTASGVLTTLNGINTAGEAERADLTQEDLLNFTLPDFAPNGDVQTVTFTAKSDSLGWVGSANITMAYNLPDVSALYQFMTQTMPSPGYLP